MIKRKEKNMLNLEELKQLIAFADKGTLSKVAEEFHISTPSVTRSMQNLEEAFGVPLFNRSKNRIELNENGELAAIYAEKLISEAQQMVQRVRALDERRKTIVVKSCAPAPMWELLKILRKSYPEITISSAICQNEEVMQCIGQQTCDIAILPFAVSMPEWRVSRFMEERLFVCVPSGHTLAGHSTLSMEELNGFNFLLRSELGFWDAMCRKKMPASKFLVQTDETAFEELIKASTLPCFTTDYIMDGNRDALSGNYYGRVNIPITDKEANVTFYLVVNKKCGFQV